MIDLYKDIPTQPDELRHMNVQDYRRTFYDIELDFLKSAPTIDYYHATLSKIIMRTPDFSEEQLKRLAQIVSLPWTAPRGRRAEEKRHFEVIDFYLQKIIDGKNVTRREMLDYMMAKYKLSEETAVKEFNLLFKVKRPEKVVVLK
jgi:hypothetical protein